MVDATHIRSVVTAELNQYASADGNVQVYPAEVDDIADAIIKRLEAKDAAR